MTASSEIYPTYYFYGPEEFLVDEEIQVLLERVLSPKERSLNLHVLSGESDNPQEIIQTAQTLPMFSRYRFVLVKDADRFEDDKIEGMKEYLQNPSPTTCLVFKGQTLGPWKKYRASIEKRGKVMEFSRLKGRSLTAWMKNRMKKKGKSLTEEAAEFLAEVVGDNLQNIENLLERISLSVGEKATIELPDIEAAISSSDAKVSTVFDLTEAIANRNVDQALGILERVLGSKAILFRKEEEVSKMDDPIPLLLSLMARQYRLILRVKELSSQKRSQDEVAGVLKMPPWRLRSLIGQAKRFSEASLREGLLKCHQTDVAIKRGRGPKELLVEKLVMDLCRGDHA
jgi:DNA polymerase III subunit delta